MRILKKKVGIQAEIECKTTIPAKRWDLRCDILIRKMFGLGSFNFGDCLIFNSSFLLSQITSGFP